MNYTPLIKRRVQNLTQTAYPIPKYLLTFLINTSVNIRKYNHIHIKTYAKGRKLLDIFFFKYRPNLTLEIIITYNYFKELNHCTCLVNEVEFSENLCAMAQL